MGLESDPFHGGSQRPYSGTLPLDARTEGEPMVIIQVNDIAGIVEPCRDEALAAEDVPVMLTIAPLRSFDQADYLAHEVPGVMVPEATLHALAGAGADAARAGLEMAAALAAECRDLADGVVLSCDDPTALIRLLSAL